MTVLALGAIPPLGYDDLGGASRPEQAKGSQAEVALNTVPQ